MTIETVEHFFSESSVLKKWIKDFSPRTQQLDMAKAVWSALENNEPLIVEAATGVGKSFAYIMPALLSGKKILLSTGTKNLQDQLFAKDIPLLLTALKVGASVALLKGRANYLCHYRIEKHARDGRFPSKIASTHFQKVLRNYQILEKGDVAELGLPDNSPIWSMVTSTNDNCLGSECPMINDCYVVKARKNAMKSDVIVINHHLFFANLQLNDSVGGELLPKVDAIIFDEAHQLPNIANHFFGHYVSSRQIIELIRDTEKEFEKLAGKEKISPVLDELSENILKLRECFPKEMTKKSWSQLQTSKERDELVSHIKDNFNQLSLVLKKQAKREKGIESCFLRSEELKIKFNVLFSETNPEMIHWFETTTQHFIVHQTPLYLAEEFSKAMKQIKINAIFTSATLTINQNFAYFKEQIGYENANELQLATPFDYATMARLYIPKNMPEPNQPNFNEKMFAAALPLINAAKGRTFFLFTSYAAMQNAKIYFAEKLNYPILMQGDKPKSQLLKEYLELKNAVLLATSSFWEGVDVKGSELVLVIIDRLPFASPSDPILQAQIESYRKKGVDPFSHLQLSHAVITLKQGVGRLIRSENDKGVVMICDPRIIQKFYGKSFIQSLPNMPIVRESEEVCEFLRYQC